MMYLSYNHEEKGYSILEFAKISSQRKDTIKINLNGPESEMDIHYSLYGLNRKEIQSGHLNIEPNIVPTSLALYHAYPNPFNPTTTLHFDIPELGIIEKTYLSVFDVRGREVDMLINEIKSPGSYKLKWNGENFSSGVYFVNMRIGKHVKTQKIILLK